MKSDYLRKEAELYIRLQFERTESGGQSIHAENLKDVNEGSTYLNKWVYEQTKGLLSRGKLVASTQR